LEVLLPTILLSTAANAVGFCEKLGTKLNQINYNTINHWISMNYTVSGIPNFSHRVEYKFRTYNRTEPIGNSSSFNTNDYIDADEQSNYDNYFSRNSGVSKTKESLVLENCYETSGTANFTIERVDPSVNVLSRKNPSFTINFTNSSSDWSVSNVFSSNCNELLHESLVNKFRDINARRNRHTSEDFYTIDLKNMVSSEVCPAHINKLRDEFNNFVRNL
jgi:hypothetical protein